MKQKRKVKSLITPQSGGNLLFSVLLFLGWWVLFFLAIALFTSLWWAVSAAGEESLQYENGIDDQVEVLLDLQIAKDGATPVVNKMSFDGSTFFMEWSAWISVEDPAVTIDGVVNYLWWESIWGNPVEIRSDNVTVIWWVGTKVLGNNANTTILWWVNNWVGAGVAWSTAPVMVWWQSNSIGTSQEGNAIIWWKSNTISNGGSYDFVIGWENNTVNGNNVIVWWAKVAVNGKSNLFVFSHGDETFTPNWWNAFYLNLKYGLWLNKDAANDWVDSNWAVSFGSVNINTLCKSEDVWVQWTWNGCLIWCTRASVPRSRHTRALRLLSQVWNRSEAQADRGSLQRSCRSRGPWGLRCQGL